MATNHAEVGLQLASPATTSQPRTGSQRVEKRTTRRQETRTVREAQPQRCADHGCTAAHTAASVVAGVGRRSRGRRRPHVVDHGAASALTSIRATSSRPISPRRSRRSPRAVTSIRLRTAPCTTTARCSLWIRRTPRRQAASTASPTCSSPTRKAFIVDGRIADAVIALEDVRRLRPAHRRLALIEAQLRKEMDRQVFLHTPEPDAAPLQPVRRREGSSAPRPRQRRIARSGQARR